MFINIKCGKKFKNSRYTYSDYIIWVPNKFSKEKIDQTVLRNVAYRTNNNIDTFLTQFGKSCTWCYI